MDLSCGLINVKVLDDTAMSRLHERYKRRLGPTDVLAFDMRDDNAAGAMQADIAICFDVARRQARRRGHDLRHELVLYALHGMLHLLGYNDHDEERAAAMHAREDELLTELGIGPVYQRETCDSRT